MYYEGENQKALVNIKYHGGSSSESYPEEDSFVINAQVFGHIEDEA